MESKKGELIYIVKNKFVYFRILIGFIFLIFGIIIIIIFLSAYYSGDNNSDVPDNIYSGLIYPSILPSIMIIFGIVAITSGDLHIKVYSNGIEEPHVQFFRKSIYSIYIPFKKIERVEYIPATKNESSTIKLFLKNGITKNIDVQNELDYKLIIEAFDNYNMKIKKII